MNKIDISSYTLDSREVADMVGKMHKNLLSDIRRYIANMEKLTGLEFQVYDFFIESTYTDAKGGSRPRYLVTHLPRQKCQFC